ncbi:DUF2254 domain-containing protein [Micromonospora sp. LOL_023]|uniref:DUF2254 domain-containing protein n=1 Tax=Micromonospora sp. LOL_023 TaxID=3345418 RepID=UPI003A89E377
MSQSRTASSRLHGLWDSFWLIPAVCAIGALVAAILLATSDLHLDLLLKGLLPNNPAGARSLLSSIITAMISFTALVFSITVIAVQLTSSQYTPRVLRNFLQDRVSQATLGTFVATFLFAMVVLAALPNRSDAQLPALSLAISMVLVLGSTGMFIYYLQHMTTLMRVSHMIAAIGVQTRGDIRRWSADTSDSGGQPALGPVVAVVPAPAAGIVVSVNLDLLAALARQHGCAIAVTPIPGDFVVEGVPLLTVHSLDDIPPRPIDATRAAQAVDTGIERGPGQDVGFGLRQLADIAERSLSPGINDTTTAVRAIQESHDLLRRLAGRPDRPSIVRGDGDQILVHVRRQSFDSHLATSIDDIRRTASGQPRITKLIDSILADLVTVARPEHRAAIRQRQSQSHPATEANTQQR